MTENKEKERLAKQKERAYQRTCKEYAEEINLLKQRQDYLPEFAYFIDLLAEPLRPQILKTRVGKQVAALFCIQAPYELFDAFGLHAVKLSSGSHSAQRMSLSPLPVLMCPMLKAYMGSRMLLDEKESYDLTVLPTTCDWVVKLPEIIKAELPNLHYLELPHIKQTEKSQQRWLEEIYELKSFLEKCTKQKINKAKLENSIDKFMDIWCLFQDLCTLRHQGFLAGVWFTVIANTFMYDDVEQWRSKLEAALMAIKKNMLADSRPKIFLAGSPIIFPNLKILHLIEQAGMSICADDLCSSERILPGGIMPCDSSEHGVLKSLAGRYHQACICPTFSDNDRRLNNIMRLTEENKIKGVIFHILKGCHPYDIESITMEEKLKTRGLKFLKIETDYVKEDAANILTRLEAFKQTLA